MKQSLFLIGSLGLSASAIWFLAQSGGLLAQQDYLSGILHIVVGLTLVRNGVELARLAVLARSR